jgi:hypothetical protein
LNRWLFDELLAAVHAVPVSVHPGSGMKLFDALLGGNGRVDNLGTVGTEAYRRVCFSMVKVGAAGDIHLISFQWLLEVATTIRPVVP